MKTTRTTWTTLACLPLLAALAPWVAELAFKPADGTKVNRRHTVQVDFELGDVTAIVDGQDMSEQIPGDFEATFESSMNLQDTFVRAAEGRALDLIRSFSAIEGKFEAMGESQDIEGLDDLDGKSVRFLWNEDEGDYDVSFHECEGDVEQLEALAADMDLSVLLPDREVAVGDTWSVPSQELRELLMLDKLGESAGDDEMSQLFASELLPQLTKLLESFKTTCEYKGEREENGRKVGVIAVDLQGEGLIDLEALILAAIEAQNAGIEIDLSVDQAELSLSLSGKGELLWDLQAGLLLALDLNADIEIGANVAINADVQGDSHEMTGDIELLGRGSWKIRTLGE